jgi:hypothetical protein
MSTRSPGLAVVLFAACGGAASSSHHTTSAQAGNSELAAAVARADAAPDKDRNLARMRLALDAMQLGEDNLAYASLNDTFASLNTVFGDNDNARKARSLWFSESHKDFKGEPYERAMVGFYLGLTYLRRHDFGNAQAAFRFGALQDAIAEEAQNASDFALLFYLEALALLEQDAHTAAAQEPLAKLAKLRPDLPAPDPTKNVLVIVETGKSPRKVTDGVGHSELRYFRGRGFRENGAQITLDGATSALYPIEDIWWQAATRGGRLVDRINNGKLEFRNRMDDIGTVLTTASVAAVTMSDSNAATGVGAGAAITGSAALIAAASTDASADDRYWDNLPDAVHVLQLSLPPGPHDASIGFLAQGTPATSPPARAVHFDVADSGLTVVWVRSRQQLSGGSP